MSYDLHTHSVLSDGTQSVEELVAEIAGCGLIGFSLTDHDTTAGWRSAQKHAEQWGLDFLPGMEISCAIGPLSVHLLSYGHQQNDSVLNEHITQARTSRRTRAQRIVQKLSETYPITWEDVLAQASPGATIGRPHIADALVNANIIRTRSEAFSGLLAERSAYYVPYRAVHPVEAVTMVKAAGGVPIMAHPRARIRGQVASAELIEQMIEAGLNGLEIYHRDNNEEDRNWLKKLAQKYDLIITGSSDYHGAGKPNRLAENTTPTQTVERIKEIIRQNHQKNTTPQHTQTI
ncbi:PHP domain-containing protein [Rothia sp. CCM 9418]|uniref:PHP domain-containing protein n=1 Tax=Rothia sp. CCM 9418 TaxID=3402661 RepID=UPI003ADB7119